MTNAQKWISVFLGLFLVLFILGRATKKDDSANYMNENYSSATTSESERIEDGLTLIKKNGCIVCHGQELNGSKMAPALIDIKKHWSRDGLINYLRNPSAYKDDRFDEFRLKYPKIVMPSYNNIDVKDLGKIADYLLTK
jgi:mono/diheme cytochrome c family protein